MGGKGDRAEENRRIYGRQAGETGRQSLHSRAYLSPLVSSIVTPQRWISLRVALVSPSRREGWDRNRKSKGYAAALTCTVQAASLIALRPPLSCLGHTAVNR